MKQEEPPQNYYVENKPSTGELFVLLLQSH